MLTAYENLSRYAEYTKYCTHKIYVNPLAMANSALGLLIIYRASSSHKNISLFYSRKDLIKHQYLNIDEEVNALVLSIPLYAI